MKATLQYAHERNFDAFTRGYLEALLWTNDPTPGNGEWNRFDETFPLLDSADVQTAVDDCAAFQRDHADLLSKAGTDAQNGHDFLLMRNRHGAGFWDHGYPDGVGRALTDAAHAYGSHDATLSGPCHHCGKTVYSGCGNGGQWGIDSDDVACSGCDDGAHDPVEG